MHVCVGVCVCVCTHVRVRLRAMQFYCTSFRMQEKKVRESVKVCFAVVECWP